MNLSLNYNKYFKEIEDLRKHPFDFYDLKKILTYFGSEKINLNSKIYSLFPQARTREINFETSFLMTFPYVLI